MMKKNDNLDVQSIILGLIILLLAIVLLFQDSQITSIRDEINKKVVITVSQKNENNITLSIHNTLNKDLSTVRLQCPTTFSYGMEVNTYYKVVNHILKQETKTIVMGAPLLSSGVPVNIEDIKTFKCHIIGLSFKDGSSVYDLYK